MTSLINLLVAVALVAGMILLRVVVERSSIRVRLRCARKASECDIEACMQPCGTPKPSPPTETNT